MDSADENLLLSEESFGFLWTDVDSSNRLNSVLIEDIAQILNDSLPNDKETNDLQPLIPVTEENCNPNVLNSCQVNNIPANTDWEGPYGFDISFQSEENKNSCVYSEIKEKLFVDMDVACPLQVKLKKPPPDGSKIRAMPIFSKPEFLTKVVKRCLIHSAPTNSQNDGHPAPQHLIRCDHEFAQYVDDPITGRQSVVVPYEKPQVGTDFTVYIYRFMCRSSCTGGLNRRATQAIFTLEKDGNLFGRKILNVRICACPIRDKKTEETQHNKQQRNLKRTYSKTTLSSYYGPTHSKLPKLGDDYIVIKILRRHYESIKKILDALTMMDILTAEQKLLLNQKLSQKSNLDQEESTKFQQYKQGFYCNKKQDLNLPSTSTGNLVRFDSNSSDDSSWVTSSRKITNADKLNFNNKYPDQHDNYTKEEDTSLSLSETEITDNSSSLDNCEFSVYFEPQENVKKSTNWTYSEIKEKLYVNMAVACPIYFKVKKLPPDGTIIRATPVFISSEFREDVVKRCLIHSSPSEVLNEGHPAPEHLIRCDNVSAQYVKCPLTKRLSVIVPYESPKVGMEYSLYIYRFMCLGSCVGGLNRRALQIIFTLEKDNDCLGQRILNIRICACPGRDRRIEEKRQLKQLKQQQTPKTVPKLRRSSNSEETFVIPKQHNCHFERVKSVLGVLDFADLLTDQQKATLHDMKLQRLNVRPLLSKHNTSHSSSSGSKYDLMKKLFKKNDSAKRKNQATLPSAKINLSKYRSLSNWLSSFGMIAYSDMFRENNFNSMEELHNFTLQDLKKLRIGTAHAEKIWDEITAYKRETSRY